MASINIGGFFGADKTKTSGTETQNATQTTTTGKQLSQAAIDKLTYDVLASDAGLASLATGENLAGGYSASTKALLAQDFVVKLVGELANVTAQTVSTEVGSATKTSSSSSSKKVGGLKTVICTALNQLGYFPDHIYNHPKAQAHFHSIHPYTLAGYHLWGAPVAASIHKHPRILKLVLALCMSRYEQVINDHRTVGGFITITLGHPICFAIGSVIAAVHYLKGNTYGPVN